MQQKQKKNILEIKSMQQKIRFIFYHGHLRTIHNEITSFKRN